MSTREEIETVLGEIYAARVRGDIDGIARHFADNATFQMAGASHSSPIAAMATSKREFLPLIQSHIDTFELSNFSFLAMIIDGDKAAVRWRATIRHTGNNQSVETELGDFVEFANGRVSSFVEHCDTALAAKLLAQH